MKLAHLSDIHFFKLSLSPLQFFSKRFVGNFNYLLRRKKKSDITLATRAIPKWKELGITHILITGDFTCAGSKKEYEMAREYIKLLKDEGFAIYTYPGNHDVYTKNEEKTQRFYKTLSNFVNLETKLPFNLIEHKCAAFQLTDQWFLVLLDLAIPRPLIKSTGLFSQECEAHLRNLLKNLPEDSSIAISGHFPLYPYLYPKAHLERGETLEKLLQEDLRVKLYIHGHRHKNEVYQRKSITCVDSGSISIKKHTFFNVIDFEKDTYQITTYKN